MSEAVGVSAYPETLLLGSWGADFNWPPVQVSSGLLLCENRAVVFIFHTNHLLIILFYHPLLRLLHRL